MRILLADDSRTMRNIQRAILAQLGHYDVDEATDGNEALARAAFIDPDLILVDAAMPGRDGLSFVRAFRETNTSTPIILMTTQDQQPRDTPAGVDALINKPFAPAALREQIVQTLAGRRLARAA